MVIEEQDLGEQEAAFDAEGDLARARRQPPTSTRHIYNGVASLSLAYWRDSQRRLDSAAHTARGRGINPGDRRPRHPAQA